MKRVRAGQLRHSIVVQKNAESRDAYGGVTNSWTNHVTLWAKIEPFSGGERIGSDKIVGDLMYSFIARVDPSVSRIRPDMRISWDSRTFDVDSVLEYKEMEWWVEIIAVEINT